MKYELCCIGHITLDKVTTPQKIIHMPGGTSFYVSHAIHNFNDIDYALVTAVGDPERYVPEKMRSQGMNITILPSKHSVYFENIYGENSNERKQHVRTKADPFNIEQLQDIEAEIFHLGALLADDFPLDIIRHLAEKGRVSIDSQGYLREVRDTHVYAVDWNGKREALQYIHFLKANEYEMEALTGYKEAQKAAKTLYEWGVKEVILTFGDAGSLIYDGSRFHRIPAYKPHEVVDATGCGDTYMAGYLYRRAKGASIEDAGNFAAALSTLKIERSGPIREAGMEDIVNILRNNEACMPCIS
jgi:sugar/nucleoside kinase (ribokinase family)